MLQPRRTRPNPEKFGKKPEPEKDHRWTDLISLAAEPDDPSLDLLGKGFLRRGGGMFIIGPTECGKSSLSVQLAIEWGCDLETAIIQTANRTPLRVLVIQSEDDRQDAREMARSYKQMGLSLEQIALVKKNTHFARWRARGGKKKIKRANGSIEFKEVSVGEHLLEILEKAILEFGPVDIIIVNPLSAYAEEGIYSQKYNREFLYGRLDRFMDQHRCAFILIHHTPKFRNDLKERTHHELLYSGSGDATLGNWPRASLFVWPADEETELFKLEAGKRHRRIGWKTPWRFFKWSDEGIFWREAHKSEVEAYLDSPKQKKGVQSISAEAMRTAYKKTKQDEQGWVWREDLIQSLIEEGYTRPSSYRCVHPLTGYQRNNFIYEKKDRLLRMKWNGFDPDFTSQTPQNNPHSHSLK